MTQEQFKALDPKVASHREELIRSHQGELNNWYAKFLSDDNPDHDAFS